MCAQKWVSLIASGARRAPNSSNCRKYQSIKSGGAFIPISKEKDPTSHNNGRSVSLFMATIN
jgi:hypothetical protein